MIIYYLTPLKYPSTYANRAQVMKMTEAFEQNGAHVTLFVSRLEGEKEEVLREYGIQTDIPIVVVSEGRRGLRALGLALGFLKIIKKAPEGTIFYIRDVKLCSWLLLLSSRFRKNYFFETHSLHRFSPYMYRICFKKARGIITTNKHKKDILILWGFGEDRVLVEPNAIDERRFEKLTTREEARRELGINGNKKMALYLGSFSPDRGSDVFLEAASHSKLENVDFWAIGGTEDQVKELKGTYPEDHIHVKGFVPYDDVPLYYSAADVLVAPWSGRFEISRVQASPLKIPEFMYSGRPIVISDLPMTREWVSKKSAFLSKPDDPHDIVEKVTYIISHEEEARRRAEQARKKASLHTWTKRAGRIKQFIESRI